MLEARTEKYATQRKVFDNLGQGVLDNAFEGRSLVFNPSNIIMSHYQAASLYFNLPPCFTQRKVEHIIQRNWSFLLRHFLHLMLLQCKICKSNNN